MTQIINIFRFLMFVALLYSIITNNIELILTSSLCYITITIILLIKGDNSIETF